MDRVAVFVDAGYFWMQIGKILYNQPSSRDAISVDYKKMRDSILSSTKDLFERDDILRIYWYDGYNQAGQPSSMHQQIAMLDGIKMRYGTRNKEGMQKGVDGLIIADMLQLAQIKAIRSAVLISGDADLVPGVEAVQTLGIKVKLASLGTADSTSPWLQQAADGNFKIKDSSILKFASKKEVAHEPTIDSVVGDICSLLTENEKSSILANTNIPRDIDAKLLRVAKKTLGRYLVRDESNKLRELVRLRISGTNPPSASEGRVQ